MPEPGKSDRWNSLLETLGVPASEPAPPAAEPVHSEAPAAEPPPAPKPQPVSMLRPDKPKSAPKPPPAKSAAKSPSYWSRIAGALGLESAAVPETPLEEPLVVPTEEASFQKPEPQLPPREEPRRRQEERPRHEERRPRRTEEAPPPELRRQEFLRGEQRDFDAGEPELPARAFQRPQREERPSREERQSAREDRPQREERPPTREERPRHSPPPPPSSLGEMFGPKTPDMDVFGLTDEEVNAPRGRESSIPRDQDESGSVLEYDQGEGSGSDLSLSGSPPRAPGEKAEEESDRDVPRRRRRRRGRGRRASGESRPTSESREPAVPRHEADIEPAGEDADFDFERDEELDVEAQVGRAPDANRDRPEPRPRRAASANTNREAESDRYPPSADRAPREPAGQRDQRDAGDERDERGSRSRRGRRRGSSRDRDEIPANRPSPYGASPDEPERFGPPRDARPPSARPARVVDEEADDDFHADVDDADEGQSGDVPTHRKIPTWDEAVGILIEANMASRANNPDRGRGRGRGRGR